MTAPVGSHLFPNGSPWPLDTRGLPWEPMFAHAILVGGNCGRLAFGRNCGLQRPDLTIDMLCHVLKALRLPRRMGLRFCGRGHGPLTAGSEESCQHRKDGTFEGPDSQSPTPSSE